MQRFLSLLRSNWLTWFGALLTTLSAMAFVTSWIYLSLHGQSHGAYAGLFVFVALPFLFVLGLGMMPFGLWLYKAETAARLQRVQEKPIRLWRLLGVLTLANFALVGTGGYEALHYMDSQQFCGTVCHTVMSPTYTAYVDSPHAHVACVDCHIGPGVGSFVKAKWNGMHQLFGVALGNYRRPIPTPVHQLRPANEICTRCHWPERTVADRVEVRRHFDDDEASTEAVTAFVTQIGGIGPDGKPRGYHWHAHEANRVEFVSTDDRRRVIPWVQYTSPDGKVRTFTIDGVDPKQPPAGERRTMDCIDCHNQPSHRYQSLDGALDGALASGRLPRSLPFARKVAGEVLQRQDWPRDGTAAAIERHLLEHYGQTGTLAAEQRAAITTTASTLAHLWLRNVHPAMQITWGTYPQFHTHVTMDDKPTGCFRCHDGEHVDQEGEPITADCNACHTVLAERERDLSVLQKFGLPAK